MRVDKSMSMDMDVGAGADAWEEVVGCLAGLTVREGRAPLTLAASPSFAPSRSTIRLFLFFRPRAWAATKCGDVGCEPGDEVWGLFEAAVIFEGLPTATTGGECITDDGREDVICSEGGAVRYRFS